MPSARTARNAIMAAAALALALACSCAPKPTWEEGDPAEAIEVFSAGTEAVHATGSASAQQAAPTPPELPAAFDLRDRGVVTPVKTQNPWGTCWAFSAIAAAETSILSDAGLTYDETGLDLSELHLAWFPFVPISEEESPAQAGEGLYLLDTEDVNAPLKDGAGFAPLIAAQLAAGSGPASEEQFPYQGSSGVTEYDFYVANPAAAKELVVEEVERSEEQPFAVFAQENYPGASIDEVLEWEYEAYTQFYATENCYSSEDDWSIDVQDEAGQPNRFPAGSFELADANYLPQLCDRSDNGVWTGISEQGMQAAKQEIFAGHGVAVCVAADQARPEDPTGDNYINTDTWAHYTYEDVPINHEVCIVGWDDAYPSSNFNAAAPPPGDGAWIAKNSWGSESGEPGDIGWSPWGVQDDSGFHTGYFYISYYDKSLTDPITLSFAANGAASETGKTRVEQHDFLPGISGFYRLSSSGLLQQANVFTASADEDIYAVSTVTPSGNTHVRFDVRLLDGEQTAIDEGELAASVWQRFDYVGHHRVELPEPVHVKQGQRFAVVCTSFKANDEGALRYMASASMDDGAQTAPDGSVVEDGSAFYARAVVNPGESYLFENGAWTDWAERLSELSESYEDVEIDNFSIKAYARTSGA